MPQPRFSKRCGCGASDQSWTLFETWTGIHRESQRDSIIQPKSKTNWSCDCLRLRSFRWGRSIGVYV
jgi:hypothetical protein